MNKKWIYFLILIILIIIWYFLWNPISQYIKINKDIEDINNLAWDIFTGDVIDTFSWEKLIYSWSEKTISENNWDQYQTYINNNKFRIYHPKEQPTTTSNDYEGRSAILNDYLTKNNFYFRVNDKINTGYLYIKLKSQTKDDIFLYWHNSNAWNWHKVSWKIRKKDNLLNKDNEFLFPLNKIPIITYYKQKNEDYNRQTELNKNQLQFIWWYVVWFDGNKIEEIVISRE